MHQDHPDIDKIAADTNGFIDGIPVRETIREIFRDPANGTPDDITKAGCLVLALKSNAVGQAAGDGKTHQLWNAWREMFPVRNHPEGGAVNGVDFSAVDFRTAPISDISFAAMQFGGHANFQKAEFGKKANFRGARWGDYANFKGAVWGDSANLVGAIFGSSAKFVAAQWGDSGNFSGAQWSHFARFTGAQWGKLAFFPYAGWGEFATFKGVQFDEGADFYSAHWDRFAVFRGRSWEQLRGDVDDDDLWNLARQWAEKRGLNANEFVDISFRRATFVEVDFSDRKFKGKTNFGSLSPKARIETVQRDRNGEAVFEEGRLVTCLDKEQHRHTTFCAAPKFHGCELHQDTSFEGAQFPPDIGKTEGTEEAAHAYQTLKLAFSKHQADNEEQFFFRLELAEKAVAHRIKAADLLRRPKFLLRNVWAAVLEVGMWLLYKIYDCTSAYGSSVLRPLVFWLVLAVISSGLYVDCPKQETCFFWAQNCTWDTDAFGRSLFHSVPFGGLTDLKNHAFSWYHSLGIVLHKAFALVFLFLIGLALRNLFKLK